ncbi:hypothetical protein BGX20_004370 [Mortierella sp. AD010]|nr:hypothetical protein BGX20_004370 [Mortierella sp. AD010]
MCGAEGHGSTAAVTTADTAPLAFPEHLYKQLTDAHCHIQDDRENIYRLVQSWSFPENNNDSSSSSSSASESNNAYVPLLTGKVCLMGVQPSKDLEILNSEHNDSDESISAKTDSLSLTSTSLPSSSTPIVTVTWNDTDTKGDWDLVSKLAHDHPDRFVPCFGIHPWFTHKYKPLEGPSGNSIELRGVTGVGGSATTNSASSNTVTPPSLSFSPTSVTPIPEAGVGREAFLAMSKQLQEHMANENREKETGDRQDATTTMQGPVKSSTQPTDTNNEPTEHASQHQQYIHYQKVLSLPNSAPENYLEELAQRLPEPRALKPALDELRRQLEKHPHAVLGEIGLDRTARILEPLATAETDDSEKKEPRKTTLALTSIQHQLDVVREQLKLAASLGRPVSFHCVQAYGHWHDFLIHEGKRLKQWDIDQGYYQTQIQKIHAMGGAVTISPISPSGVRLSKKSTARLQREAREAAWERHVASTLQESSDEEDEDGEDGEDDEVKTTGPESDPPLADPANGGTAPKLSETPPFEAVLPPRLCMHSYGGSVDMLKAFVKMDHPPEMFFSFSILINGRLQERKLKELILAVPEDRLLIESDHHSHAHVDHLLVEMVHKIAEFRGWSIEETVEKTARNWNRFVYG